MNDATFTEYLYQSYLNLGKMPEKPAFFTASMDLDKRSFLEKKDYGQVFNMIGNSFREKLYKKIGKSHLNGTRPQDLHTEMRSPEWQFLCDSADNFADLDNAQKLRLLRLLRRLPFYTYVIELVGQIDENLIRTDSQIAEIAYNRLMARYLLAGDKIGNYKIEEAEQFAKIAPKASYAKVHATYITVQQSVKLKHNLAKLEESLKNYWDAIAEIKPTISTNEYLELMSRYYRIAAFLPQMTNKPEQMVEEMELAKQYAFQIQTDGSPDQEFAKQMVYYPIAESNIKAAMWVSDWDLAKERAEHLISLSPNTPSPYLHYGQILIELEKYEEAIISYEKAIRYAPMGEEIAYYMAGQCYEVIGYEEKALDYYIASMHADPYGISNIEATIELSEKLDNQAIRNWALERKQILESQNPELKAQNELKAYQGKQFDQVAEAK